MGFPCPSFADDEEDAAEEEKEKEEDMLPVVPVVRAAVAVTGQRWSRSHSGPGVAPLQSWLRLPLRRRSAGALRSHELQGNQRLPPLLAGSSHLGCPGNRRRTLVEPMWVRTASEGITAESVRLA